MVTGRGSYDINKVDDDERAKDKSVDGGGAFTVNRFPEPQPDTLSSLERAFVDVEEANLSLIARNLSARVETFVCFETLWVARKQDPLPSRTGRSMTSCRWEKWSKA